MRLSIVAVGRLRSGPEHELISDYQSRLDRTGRSFGIGPLSIVEIEDRKHRGKAQEAKQIASALPGTGIVCCLDERGRSLSSPQVAQCLARWRDDGHPSTTFVIGGADGIDTELVGRADQSWSLGKMVWPHMLARVMLTEQLYRAVTILAGSPYHRA